MGVRAVHSGAGEYRPDIDGLRAVAVCSVLAFHAKLPYVTGGFTGVDIFFVISGFLITSLLVKEWQRDGRISLLGFWTRRVRRLAPALLFVLALVLAAATVFLHRISGEVGILARTMLWTVAVNANHYFLAQDGDYFAPGSEINPLLHMWSLAVEEQFYLVWPLAIAYVLVRWGTAGARRLTIGIVLASFSLSCYWTVSTPAVAFYTMPSRAWELMIGGFLAILLAQSPKSPPSALLNVGGWAGVAMLVASITLLDDKTPFPAPSAAIAVLGTALLIWAGYSSAASGASQILSARPVVYIGKISYPLYLWHWPVLVILRSTRLYRESLALDMAALALSAVLAVVTYEVIEKGTWNLVRNTGRWRVLAYGFAGNVVILGLAVLVAGWVRFGWGYSPEELALDASRKDMPKLDCMFQERFPEGAALENCYPARAQAAVLLWGDSHANHWRPAIERAAASTGLQSAVLTMNACRPLPGPVGRDECVGFNRAVLEHLPVWARERGLHGLVLSGRWPEGTGTIATSIIDRASWKPGEFFDRRAKTQAEALQYFEQELRSVLDVAKASSLRVVLVLPSPVQRFAASHCLSVFQSAECKVSRSDLMTYTGPAETVLRRVAANYDNVRLLDPRAFMCIDDACPVVIENIIAYTDDDHVSQTFSLRHAARFEDALAWIRKKPLNQAAPLN